ncbi:MAG: hypothetical protein GF309_00680 [Candidatus Lokiarchaeota archaeon]|nr:hypothetical protein [Candidatus Lokiarchaeota archaeon]
MSETKKVIPNLPIAEWFELERNMEIVARMSTEPVRAILTRNIQQEKESL